ncbi:hypothetical protein H5410_047432 [Solanum commersonii]|uniref:At1g61320/AtMIF1 LRR domain-containing protein n=1 Tax=Solanum commersonii TaxID=4109 RepID=A0A9J5XIN5_SOLCO|nr:hypothetical protein H5410_047432 [Solanum commersonii]
MADLLPECLIQKILYLISYNQASLQNMVASVVDSSLLGIHCKLLGRSYKESGHNHGEVWEGGVVNCNSLRKISLSNVRLDENMLQTLLNSCLLIVSFILENCSGMKVLKIKSDSLKVLKIIQYYKIFDIDAPNLVSLDYTGSEIPELNIARESSQLKNSKIFLNGVLSSLNTA